MQEVALFAIGLWISQDGDDKSFGVQLLQSWKTPLSIDIRDLATSRIPVVHSQSQDQIGSFRATCQVSKILWPCADGFYVASVLIHR